MRERKEAECVHCGVRIVHFDGRLWHDGDGVFPQYCRWYGEPRNESALHEPKIVAEVSSEL